MSRSVNLQRRHYEFIADLLKELKDGFDLTDDQHAKIVRWFTHALRSTNANFKTERFYDRSRGVVKAKPVRVRKPRVISSAPMGSDADDTNYWE